MTEKKNRWSCYINITYNIKHTYQDNLFAFKLVHQALQTSIFNLLGDVAKLKINHLRTQWPPTWNTFNQVIIRRRFCRRCIYASMFALFLKQWTQMHLCVHLRREVSVWYLQAYSTTRSKGRENYNPCTCTDNKPWDKETHRPVSVLVLAPSLSLCSLSLFLSFSQCLSRLIRKRGDRCMRDKLAPRSAAASYSSWQYSLSYSSWRQRLSKIALFFIIILFLIYIMIKIFGSVICYNNTMKVITLNVLARTCSVKIKLQIIILNNIR